ncbi:Ubiquitin fusion degradation protein 1-like protein [Hypsibius exemplaris]|uniref:Ubiquitin fusion degradation protein 1 homolog n=1 Tax=Hypsibius exemplaris TaxID=2072580 RepID=A0A1W0WQV2_HYPEX|nr:Ubiquitin fusion degradation protein 1-like protein [Hypsibius exemplaris]
MFGIQEIFGMFPGARGFRRDYKCYSIAMLPHSNRPDVEKGGKIILPPSALHLLSQMNVQFPMLFKLKNTAKNTVTHCGVLEFIADEGLVYMPSWMMRNLLMNEGDLVTVESVNLPVASYSKFQPQSVDFLDISDPRAVLESTLRGVACLTVGDVIAIEYNSKIFELLVLETKPSNAVSIIECDMQVDFAAPVGYQEPVRAPKKAVAPVDEPMMIDADVLPDAQKFSAFTGSGSRLGGHKNKKGAAKDVSTPVVAGDPVKKQVDVASLGHKGVPNYDWKPGRLTFRRNIRKPTVSESDAGPSFSAFSGQGFSLKKTASGRV